jgi:hypothetical protein
MLGTAVVKRKIPSPRRESKPRIPIVQPVAQRYSDWAIAALYLYVSEYNLKKESEPQTKVMNDLHS